MVRKIINLHASWCAPCKAFEPIFNEVSKNDKYNGIEFESYDIEDDEGSVLVEQHHIRSVPSTLFFDENEKLIIVSSGSISKYDFEGLIDKYFDS